MASFFDDDPEGAQPHARASLRERLHTIIFRADTPAGKGFDVTLLIVILTSVLVVMLDSVPTLQAHRPLFRKLEWAFTALFTAEYALRLYCARSSARYALSFYGLVDLVSLLPSYLGVLQTGHPLLVIRSLRLLRMFRILRLGGFLQEGRVLTGALVRSRRKILVFLSGVMILNVILGAFMYVIEGPASGFTSIPISVYWSIVTLTTVGYGDLAPQTALGRMLASVIMVIGYAIIAVPTGIVTAELTESAMERDRGPACPRCEARAHALDARFCRVCGASLRDGS